MATCLNRTDPDRLRRLLADTLSAGEQAETAAHLEDCAECRTRLEEMAAGSQLWGDLRLLRGGETPPTLDTPAPPATAASAAGSDAVTGGDVEGDDDLAALVVSLGFLEPPGEPGHLGRLGQYDVLDVVGRGGMGIVLKARDRALDRLVAVKVLAPGMATGGAARKRFAREAKAAAAVVHEHVVAIHAVDATPGGLPYLVMQYVAGRSLQERLDRDGPLDVREVVRIGMQTASGLAAAHAQGLVHRDVKPANILLENGVERVKITDFGLARAADDASVTQSGVVAGTPQYMAPEQARGDAVDHRSDLFSLGSVLYALCTGVAPFRGGSSVATLKRVCDEDPPAIQGRNPETPDWLVRLVARLHAKDPADRFGSAAELAGLLERCLAHLQRPSTVPLPAELAGPRPAPQHTRRWAAAAAVVLAATLGLAATKGVAQQVADYVATVLRIPTPDGMLVVEADDPNVKIQVDDGEITITGAGPQEVRLKPGKHQVRALKDGKPIHEELVTITRGGKRVVAIRRESDAPGGVPVSPAEIDARVISRERATAGRPADPFAGGGTFRRWGPADKPANDPRRWVWSVAYSPDGKSLAIATGRWDAPGAVWLRDTADGKTRALPNPTVGVRSAVYAPDGKTLAQVNFDATVFVRDTRTDAVRSTIKGHTNAINSAAFSPDGTLLATGSQDKTVKLWDPANGREVRTLSAYMNEVWSVAFSPDGKSLASGSSDGWFRLWDVATGKERAAVHGHQNGIHALAFSPDGKTLATASWDHLVRLWDADTGKEVVALQAHAYAVSTLAFSPDGKRLVTGSGVQPHGTTGEVILWDISDIHREPQTASPLAHARVDGRVWGVAFSPDGKRITVGREDGVVATWNAANFDEIGSFRVDAPPRPPEATPPVTLPGASTTPASGGAGLPAADPSAVVRPAGLAPPLATLQGHDSEVRAVAFAPDGRLASGAKNGSLFVWDLKTDQRLELDGHKNGVEGVAFSPDGKILASGGWDHEVRLWDPSTGKPAGVFHHHTDGVRSVAFSPDGKSLASGGWDRMVNVWGVDTGQPVWTSRRAQPVNSVRFSTDGKRLAAAVGDWTKGAPGSPVGQPGELVIWDVPGFVERASLGGAVREIKVAAFSPDGRFLAAGSGDGTVRVWGLNDPTEHALLLCPSGTGALAFSPDGETLASGQWNGTVILWDATKNWSQRANFLAHESMIPSLAFAPDGRTLATASQDRTVKLWGLKSPQGRGPAPAAGPQPEPTTASPLRLRQ